MDNKTRLIKGLREIKRGIENGDWKDVCAGYTQITKQEINIPQPKNELNLDEIILELEEPNHTEVTGHVDISREITNPNVITESFPLDPEKKKKNEEFRRNNPKKVRPKPSPIKAKKKFNLEDKRR